MKMNIGFQENNNQLCKYKLLQNNNIMMKKKIEKKID